MSAVRGQVLQQAVMAGHPYTPVLVSPHGGSVTTSSGLVLSDTTAAPDAGPLDTVVVAGAARLTGPDLDEELLFAVRRVSEGAGGSPRYAPGAFVLARLGLL